MSAKLGYIVSAGHSGSTLLDLIVGSMPSCFSTGELTYLPWQISRREFAGPNASPQKLCSCGNGFHECAVWAKILRNVSAKKGFDVYQEPFRFKMNLPQNEKYTSGRFSRERIQRGLYLLANKYDWLYPMTSVYQSALSDVVKNNWLLYDTMSESSDVKFVVDSSKSVLRLNLLYRHRADDVYAIVLLRNVRGVAYSDQRLGNDPVKRAEDWVREYNRIAWVMRCMPDIRCLFLRYKHIVGNPEQARARIASFLGVEDMGGQFQIDTKQRHLVAGNSMRHKGVIKIRPGLAWKEGLSPDVMKRVEAVLSRLDSFWAPMFESADYSN